MNQDSSSRDRLQNHKMVHIPVHDRRHLQALEVIEFEAHRSADETHLACYLDQGPERGSFQRHRMATPECIQVDAVAVIRANHRQAGEPAFSGLGLLDNWEAAMAAEIQQGRHDHILTLSRGSRSQLISERFSRMISALKSISAWSGIFLS